MAMDMARLRFIMSNLRITVVIITSNAVATMRKGTSINVKTNAAADMAMTVITELIGDHFF
jgi:hypothetical protein